MIRDILLSLYSLLAYSLYYAFNFILIIKYFIAYTYVYAVMSKKRIVIASGCLLSLFRVLYFNLSFIRFTVCGQGSIASR